LENTFPKLKRRLSKGVLSEQTLAHKGTNQYCSGYGEGVLLDPYSKLQMSSHQTENHSAVSASNN
jgi:hypothetical protein